ncbi:MAG: fructosamine kinase family protein [Alteromonas sp.]|nr:fructosamine kinase family protein [Flavobacteriaceae bacterium]MCB9212344.1 fructosamine kinase family protein [Alteromonas sp.]
MEALLQSLAENNGFVIHQRKPLAGGDINKVLLLETSEGCFVVKINDKNKFPKMFEAEAKGLELLRQSQSFQIPDVKSVGEYHEDAYLLLAYLEAGPKSESFWEHFGQLLALLHQKTAQYFGLDHDNYIGSLPQYNSRASTTSEFYITQRLEPQFRMARQRGFEIQNLDAFFKNVAGIIPSEAPALIHGDLWNGNYLVSNGYPALIDPAVAYAPREMDLAMMQLFGGFPEIVFRTYHECFPIQNDWQERLSFWQLYYLLAHLNLFGSGYLPSVQKIVNQYC